MCKKVVFSILVLALCVMTSARGADIVFVSFHGADDAPSQAAVDVGFTVASDIGYTDLLTAAGHNVTRYITNAAPDAEILNAADLVIISRAVSSSHYSNDGATAWNGITSPMIIMGGYVLRSSRMGYTTGTTMVDTAGDIALTVSNPTHPIFAGIPITDGTMDNPFAMAGVPVPTAGAEVSRGISINNDPADDEGTVLATIATADDPAVGGMVIGEWPAGATLEHAGGAGADVLAGPRLVFLTGSREPEGVTGGDAAGLLDLYEDGAQILLNAVDYMLPVEAVDPGADSLVAHYKLDGDVLDSSGNGLDGTIVGDPAFVAGQIGMALQCDGVDDSVDMGNDAMFDITGEVTLAIWVNTQDIGNGEDNPWLGKGDTSYMIKGFRTGNQIEFFIYDGGWNSSYADVGDAFNGEWHHAAGTFDGAEFNIYVDGVLTTVLGYEGPGIVPNTYNVSIGTNSQASGRFSESIFDDARIYNRKLSAGEIAYLANANLVKGVTHLYTFEDGTANDSVGDADGVLIGGAVVEGGALVTAAQDQWMEMPGDVIAINTYDAVTVEAFYTPTAGANTSWTMLAYFGDSTDPDPTAGVGNDGFFITSARGDDVSRAAISVGNPEAPYSVESGANGPEYDDGLPHHIASTIDDTEITLYLDGELIAATELSETNKLSGLSTNYALLAKGGYGSDPEWIGEIEEFRIYNRALSPAELAASYAAGPEKAGPQPVDPGTEGLIAAYPLDSAGRGVTADVSGNGLDGTVVGDPVFVEGVVGQALDLDGDGDYVDCGASPLFDVTDAITVSVWVNIRSLPQAWTAVVTKGDGAWRISNNSSSMGMHFGFENGSRGWQAANSASELNAGEWAHVCGVYDINVGAKIYINGVEDGSNPDTEGITVDTYNVFIGANHQTMEGGDPRCFDGQIDEVYIYGRPLSDLEVMYLAGL